MTCNILENIQVCLPYVKWFIATWFVPLTPIQIGEPYELMGRDFIGFFKRFSYKNIYIYNLVNNFLKHIYPHPTVNASIKNVIFLFNFYFRANFKSYTIYMDANSYFTRQKL